jgi:hypothetical protein
MRQGTHRTTHCSHYFHILPPLSDAPSPGAHAHNLVCLPQGTLDAIYLGVQDGPEKYVEASARAVCTGGVCVITSCNYTRDELVALMTSSGPWWSHVGSLEYEEISYGGGTGSRVVSESFRRKVVSTLRS